MAPLFFVLTIFSVPFLPAGATVPRWAFLSLACAALFFHVRPNWKMLAVIAYLGIMAHVAPIWYDALYLYWHFLLLAVLFTYAQDLTDLREIALGLGLGMTVNSAVVVAQYLGWNGFVEMTATPGLFFNYTFSAEAAAMAVALAVGYRIWWLLPCLAPSLLSGSRTPILALGIAGLVYFWPRDLRRQTPFLALMLPLGAAVVVFSHYAATGFWATLQIRLGVWQDTVAGLNLFGHGLGSFISEFPALQHHSDALEVRFENPHNDILQVIYELGLGGAVLIGWFFWRLATAPRTPEWYALATFIVIGCCSFPLYEPVTGAVAAVCAGCLFGCGHPVRDVLGWQRHRVQAGYAHGGCGALSPGGIPISTIPVPPIGTGLCRDNRGRPGSDTRNPGGVAA